MREHHLPIRTWLRSVPTLFLQEPLLRIRAAIALLIFSAFSVLWTSLVLTLSAPPLSLSHTPFVYSALWE
jgi:hypothetical protein